MRQPFAVLFILIILAGALAAQSNTSLQNDSAGQEGKGLTSYVQFGGSSNSSGHVLKLDSAVGYNFNRHFGVDAGVPIYFVGSAATSTTPS